MYKSPNDYCLSENVDIKHYSSILFGLSQRVYLVCLQLKMAQLLALLMRSTLIN